MGSIPITRSTLIKPSHREGFLLERLMSLMVNGRDEPLPNPQTLEGLVDALYLTGQRLAIEHNGYIVPRSEWWNTAVKEEDRIEIVKAIGGG